MSNDFLIGCIAGMVLMTVFVHTIYPNNIEELKNKNAAIIPAKGSVDINCTVRFTNGEIESFIIN